MARIGIGLWMLAILGGCGEAVESHQAPTTRPEKSSATPDANAATKAPRAIATH